MGYAWKWPTSLLPIASWPERSHVVTLTAKGPENVVWPQAHEEKRTFGPGLCLDLWNKDQGLKRECQRAACLGAHEGAIRQ